MGYCTSCNVDGVTLVSVPLQRPAMDIAPVMTGAGGYSWSSQEKLLVGSVHSRFVYDGDPTIYICDVKAGSCKRVAKPRDAADLTPAWSADGRRIAFARGSVAALGGRARPPGLRLDRLVRSGRARDTERSGPIERVYSMRRNVFCET
jgi:Tol biopolymer transport system component